MATRRKPQSKEVTFGMWLAGTRWGLKMALGLLAGLTAMFVFFKLGGDLGLDRWLLAHRGYVEDRVEASRAPLRQGLSDIRADNANNRLNELEKQLLDNELAKFAARGTPGEIPLNAQANKLKDERDKLLRLLEQLNATPGTR